ncbi:hypothetical protein C1S86_25720 [Vibrio parahaemolyticus]|uniref:DUF4365 domain-containing protein n=2 Tax=Vibrionaceae TaxID=641 RepID=UPI000C87C94A|nr:DUF4365 domain-containing protein [Vibrio parahaemolyticus]ELK8511172.1 DUF4365 domain-containing protein [Vibrio vulnificus]EGR3325547.1 DUF4365 domain-containing protein [Vibrio parahaemolyticus]ELK8997743.1 DUF4365 domain-containing protein [Vibrio vulnificus]ELS3558223.1 DUF4365 domain-containing protein [Vibrio vulnificus]MDF4308035.1 DUF4365 domain-containing protein [Vibrio parahaemolyticus]
MFYPKNTASGNAGEYYFAYWVSRHLNWPCRLLSIDVGIDAQVEIFDKSSHSTGNFIAIQIKTTGKKSPNVPVKVSNLEYWKTIKDVVVLVSITMFNKTPKIYWKVINDEDIDYLIEEAKNKKQEHVTIKFGEGNVLLAKNKSEWSLLPYRGYDVELTKLASKIIEVCDDYNAHFYLDDSYSPNNVDIEEDYIIENFSRVCDDFYEMEEILKQNYKLSTLITLTDPAYEKYELFKENVSEYLKLLFRANSERKSEYKNKWSYPSVNKTLAEMVVSAHDRS